MHLIANMPAMVGKFVTLRYRQVEAALVAAAAVKPSELGAFRAQLRHLRKLGLPDLPKPGSGRQISYTERHAFEMYLALELEDIGLPPRTAAEIAPSIVRALPLPHDIRSIESDGAVFAAITLDRAKKWTRLFTRRSVGEFLESELPSFSLVNLSICARKLDKALQTAGNRQ